MREMLVLAGKMDHAAFVIRPGQTFPDSGTAFERIGTGAHGAGIGGKHTHARW